MSRCDYDTIFQRVSCVTLVAIAVTFTIILTNVFVDIDGLLTRKDRGRADRVPDAKTHDSSTIVTTEEHIDMNINNSPNLIRPDFYKEDPNYDDNAEDINRSKRSLETSKFLFHVKTPQMRTLLNDHLASLLEEMDVEEPPEANSKKEDAKTAPIEWDPNVMAEQAKIKTNHGRSVQETHNKLDSILDVMRPKDSKKDTSKIDLKKEEDIFHLAMHNILFQGIIGHMDLEDVFKKVHMMMRDYKFGDEDSLKDPQKSLNKQEQQNLQKDIKKQLMKAVKHNPKLEENKFFEELMKCNKLYNDLINLRTGKTEEPTIVTNRNHKGPKLLIKTIIDISSNKDKTNNEIMNSKESIKGIIKLIYNGKSIEFSRMEDDDKPSIKNINENLLETPDITPNVMNVSTDNPIDSESNDPNKILVKQESRRSKKSFYNKIIDSYLKRIPENVGDALEDSDTDNFSAKFEPKRRKRQVKIRNQEEENTTTTDKSNANDDDDELYVEIETHFDSKGLKGMKKKKLIRNIVEKIQKAIHSDLTVLNDHKKKKRKHLQIKKRTQNPLDKNKALLLKKLMVPIDNVIKRHSDPISKLVPLEKLADKSGETWKKSYYGPGFLTASKSMNSAEMGEVDVDYNKIMDVNGIPQRLQKPLNTENTEELLNAKTYFDLGNLKFYIKNIDGAGLSIGFNQYTDEPPGPETMNLFTGIENMIKTTADKNEEDDSETKKSQNKIASEDQPHDLEKRNIIHWNNKEHIVYKRSVEQMHEKDFHNNEYKMIFDGNFLPYDNYQEIYEDSKKRVSVTMNKENLNNFDPNNFENSQKNLETRALPTLMDENIFFKKLKPSEILSLASLLDRKKRSLTVNKIKKIRTKHTKLNRYLNTKSHGRKLILNKKRHKRQIDKIRIIATDSMNKRRHSDENIFVIDDDNILADRAIVRDIDNPDAIEIPDEKQPEEHYDSLPYIDEEPTYSKHIFDGRFRQNPLMSKYPHILLEEIGRSQEDIEPFVLNKFEINPRTLVENKSIQSTLYDKAVSTRRFDPSIEEIINPIEPKQNYRLTVKIFPKNDSDMGPGFKEIHTSINKSFNRDGLMFTSLLNVSEISKITKMNETTDITSDILTPPPPIVTTESAFVKHIKEQQNKMDSLLKQHKKRIDEQLDHLKRERLNLDTLSLRPTDSTRSLDTVRTLDIVRNNERVDNRNKDSNMLNMNKDDVTSLLASALFNLQTRTKVITTTTKRTKFPSVVSSTTTKEFTTTEATTVTTTMQSTTTTEPTTTPQDPVKIKMLSKIQENENVTNEILHQINKNTEMLQKFLLTLTDKLLKERDNAKELEEKENQHDMSEERKKEQEYAAQRFWKPFHPPSETDPQYRQQAEYLQPKNESQYSIPIIYAYQRQMPVPSYKQNVPVASVIYHGHIHTKSFEKRLKSKDSKNSNRYNNMAQDASKNDSANQTRYFIDDLESNYKTVSARKPRVS